VIFDEQRNHRTNIIGVGFAADPGSGGYINKKKAYRSKMEYQPQLIVQHANGLKKYYLMVMMWFMGRTIETAKQFTRPSKPNSIACRSALLSS
jgi:hypothetical protein